ncbi:MAG TPA: hypothetical protein VES19_10195 [Candidatus Limnocylindrales bacterium]|nr:hypothetical protein [Candidatus Limnocylindrales bacterium]
MTRTPARDRQSRWRWLLAVCAGTVAILAAGCGAQVETARTGTVEFGTGGSGCTIEGVATSFPSGAGAIYDVAHFAREVSTGEVVTFRVLQDGKELAAVPRAFTATGDCLGGALPEGLPPARYRIEFLAGTELLAAGEFDVAP